MSVTDAVEKIAASIQLLKKLHHESASLFRISSRRSFSAAGTRFLFDCCCCCCCLLLLLFSKAEEIGPQNNFYNSLIIVDYVGCCDSSLLCSGQQ